LQAARCRSCGAASGYPGAAHDAGGGTGHVSQDAIEALAIPPAVFAGVAGDQLRPELQTVQVFGDALQTARIVVQRLQFDVGQFQQVAGLAARRGYTPIITGRGSGSDYLGDMRA